MRLIGIAVMLTVSLVVAPFAAEAQQKTIPRVAVISALTREAEAPLVDAFREALQNLGYVEGRNIAMNWQYTDGKPERFAEAATELVRQKVDVIVAMNNPGVVAALTATKTTPIVMLFGLDPVGLGFVASLSHPGGTVTGCSSYLPELVGTRLEFVREVVPNASRVAVLWDSNLTGMQKLLTESELSAKTHGVQLQFFDVRTASEFEGAFAGMTRQGVRAVLSLGSKKSVALDV